jgi:hypothetical protein
VLAQVPSAAEAAGIALVVAGVGLHREATPPPARPEPSRPRRHGSLATPSG